MDEQAKVLASYALDRLAAQASRSAIDKHTFPEPWISMVQLRDDVLRDEFSAARRAKLWVKVQKKVEQNTNVRPMAREGRHGDVSKVWEWIGALDFDDPAARSARRKSGRYSLGTPLRAADSPAFEDSPLAHMRQADTSSPAFRSRDALSMDETPHIKTEDRPVC